MLGFLLLTAEPNPNSFKGGLVIRGRSYYVEGGKSIKWLRDLGETSHVSENLGGSGILGGEDVKTDL